MFCVFQMCGDYAEIVDNPREVDESDQSRHWTLGNLRKLVRLKRKLDAIPNTGTRPEYNTPEATWHYMTQKAPLKLSVYPTWWGSEIAKHKCTKRVLGMYLVSFCLHNLSVEYILHTHMHWGTCFFLVLSLLSLPLCIIPCYPSLSFICVLVFFLKPHFIKPLA